MTVFVVASLVLVSFFYLTLAQGIEPFTIFAAVALLVFASFMVVKVPLVLVGGLLFVGMFKTKAAEGVSLSDPTFVMLALVTVSIVARLLFASSRTERLSIRTMFAGQAGGLVLCLLFVCVVAGSYLYAPATHYGVDKVLRLCTINLVLFISPLVLLRDERDLRFLAGVFVVLALALAFLTVFGVFELTEADRGEAHTRIGEASYIGIAILILLYFNFLERLGRTVAIICVPLLTTALVASLARGPLVSLFLVLPSSLMIIRKNVGPISRRLILVGALATVAVSGVAFLWIDQVPTARGPLMRKEAELTALINSGNPGGTAGMRLAYYKAALAGFVEKPILGWGAGAWPIYYWGVDKRTYPHNIFLETAFEQGLVGLVAFLVFLSTVFVRLLRLLQAADGRFAFLFPVMLFCLSVSSFSGDITAKDLWFWAGAVFAAARIAEYTHSTARPDLFNGQWVRRP